ncbi:MAG: aspartate aminotransferase [Candidatus Marinimicrobia bacterium]|nr:aspartate aminotransferase [Candidatus Neomarinimicrobiota bacterium]
MISKRVEKIQPSFTLEMTAKAAELRRNGVDVINLGVGEPDFNTPKNIRAAALKAMDEGHTKYTPGKGTFEIRDAICEKLSRDNSIKYNPDQIIVSSGAKHSLSTLFQAILNPNDEVIIFSPFWVSFPDIIRLADGNPITVQTNPNDNFSPIWEDFHSKTSHNTKAILINSPSNPTGSVWNNEIIEKILKICKKNNWIVVSDECYEKLVYDTDYQCAELINSRKKINANVITIQSMSKTYAMTGWRIGYTAGDQNIINAMSKIQGQATSCPNSIAQKAAIEALTGNQKEINDMKKIFKKRRKVMIDRLNKIPNINCQVPGGAFYAFPDISYYLNGRISDSFKLSDYILDKANTVTVAGAGFGMEGFIRLSYATDEKIFLEGINRIEKTLLNLN